MKLKRNDCVMAITLIHERLNKIDRIINIFDSAINDPLKNDIEIIDSLMKVNINLEEQKTSLLRVATLLGELMIENKSEEK